MLSSPFPRSQWGIATTTFFGALLGLALAGAAAPALATPIVYQSQTGSVSASGSTDSLSPTSQTFPISGLSGANQTALVEAGDPNAAPGTYPGYYMAQAQLQTVLGGSLIQVDLSTVATATPGSPPPNGSANANAQSSVSIQFSLPVQATVLLGGSSNPTAYNGPAITLKSLDLGFQFQEDYMTNISVACGTLSQTQCDQVFYSSAHGFVFPAGNYELDADAYAFEPGNNSCSVGCGSAGGSVTLSVTPEPASDALLGAGLGFVAVERRRRAAGSRGGRLSRERTRR